MTDTLSSIAAEAVDREADVKTAIEAVVAHVTKDPALFQRLALDSLKSAAAAAVHAARHAQRTEAKQMPALRTVGVLMAADQPIRKAFLDTWLVGNKRLGDCDAEDLSVAAQREVVQAAGHQKNASFYLSLRSMLNGNRVREAMDDDKAMDVLSNVGGRGHSATEALDAVAASPTA